MTMTPDNKSVYRELMRDIKRRMEAIESIGNTDVAIYNAPRVEFICLQLRLILESIAFGCLVANGDRLKYLSKKILKEYRAEEVLSQLEDINPACYPQPVTLVSGPETSLPPSVLNNPRFGRYRGQLEIRSGNDWLTRDEFKDVYGRLGDILHVRNPMRGPNDFEHYEEMAPQWLNKIINLLTHHCIGILSDDMMYIVLMQGVSRKDDGHIDGDVSIAEFQKMEIQKLPEKTGQIFSRI